MTNEFVNGVEVTEVTEEVKPKRSRAKAKKTGAQIHEEITILTSEVNDLQAEVDKLDSNSVVFDIVNDVYEAKKAELEAALNHLFTV